MASDFQDICYQSGTTPNEDVEFGSIGGQVEDAEFKSIQLNLETDFNVSMSIDEIKDTMEEHGIDLTSVDWITYLPHELVYEALLEESI